MNLDALNVFSIKEFEVLEVGNVKNTAWKPIIRYSTAAAQGYRIVKEPIQEVVEPVWKQHHVEIVYQGMPVVASAGHSRSRNLPIEFFSLHISPHGVRLERCGLLYRVRTG